MAIPRPATFALAAFAADFVIPKETLEKHQQIRGTVYRPIIYIDQRQLDPRSGGLVAA